MFSELLDVFSVKVLPHSEVEISGEIPPETLLPYRDRALKSIAAQMELPGFRKGFVPQDIALKKVGEVAVLQEAAELFMREFYPELIAGKKLDAVGRPDIAITKLAPGNPVAFHIRTALYPKVEMPSDWQNIGRTIPLGKAEEVSDEEVEKTLDSLQKSRKVGDELPELNDEFARSVGAFANLSDLKAKMKEGMEEEKKRAARDKRRGAIIEALLGKIQIDMPNIFIESEQEKMIAQLKDDTARFNIPFEEYLKRVGKDEATLRGEYRNQAEQRAKLQLVLNKIADDEKIEADSAAVEEEMKHAIEHFPNAKPELVRIHIETVLRNEKVLQKLELQEEKE